MSLTLFETLRQIDPYVKLTDGFRVNTAGAILGTIDPADPAEFVLSTDGLGRLMIYKLNVRGCIICPPVYVEEKVPPPRQLPVSLWIDRNAGFSAHGFV